MMTAPLLNKIGRNDLCSCGSGKKYKKCCFNTDTDKEKNFNSIPVNIDEEFCKKVEKITPMTSTNEYQMPVRLYYKIRNKKALIEELSKLKCVSWYEEPFFSIDYHKETRGIGLEVKHNQVPKELYPVILAHGTIVNNKELHLDLRSFLRAIEIVKFIEERIGKSAIRLGSVASYNYIQEITPHQIQEFMDREFDDIFSEKNMTIFNPKAKIQEFKEAQETAKNAKSKAEKKDIVADFFTKLEQEEMPLIEKFPVSPYKNGIRQLESDLMLKMTVALHHYAGHKDFTLMDALQLAIGKHLSSTNKGT